MTQQPATFKIKEGRGCLSRLARDAGGNTLAMMAAAMVPVCALTGSAIDTARLYVVKVRLQQACDAGVLAGRKFMESSNAATLDSTATVQAKAFFNNNFRPGWMQARAVSFTPAKTTDQQVSGTASATVPMTVMKVFAAPDVRLSVVCEARYDVADADIMFVLDTTGSMACAANETSGCSQPTTTYTRPDGTIGYQVTEKSTSKIVALRSAVLNFYDTLDSAKDPSTNIRYGVVSYTSTVNAGFAVRALSPDYLVDQWTYNSRRIVADANNGSYSDTTIDNIRFANCNARAGRVPAPALTYSTSGTAVLTTVVSWTANTSGDTNLGRCITRAQPLKPMWRYQPVQFDVSRFKRGDTVIDPSKITGAKSQWQGCLEERSTVASSSFSQSSLPADLDPDLIPSSDDTRWRPMWSDVVYYRGNTSSADYAGNGSTPYGDLAPTSRTGATSAFTNLTPTPSPAWDQNIRLGYVSCGKPVQRLDTLSREDLSDYLNASDFVPQGGTYHDTGMIWGTRLLSPTGPFRGDTSAWPGRNSPNRFIVFMTDGDMSPNPSLYGMYGIEDYDDRVTGGTGNALDNHNARFLAECEAAKARNIRVFVVAFGQTLTSQLTTCASPGQAYYASDNAGLRTAFINIAKQVAMLRVSQ